MTIDEQMQLKIAEARAFQTAKLIELTGMVQEYEQKIQSINAAASRWRTYSPAEILEAMAENKEREENAAESERSAFCRSGGPGPRMSVRERDLPTGVASRWASRLDEFTGQSV